MDFREQLRFMEERKIQGLKKEPELTHKKYMDMRVYSKELQIYPGSFANENIIANLFRRIIGARKVKRKYVIICHSAEEINRKADALMEQGYMVERKTGVQPVQLICIPIYKVEFWK